jgi:hypothetical protein
MVHNLQSNGVPLKRHDSLESAQHEAQRLARHHMGNQVAVLECVDCYQAEMPEAFKVEVVAIA